MQDEIGLRQSSLTITIPLRAGGILALVGITPNSPFREGKNMGGKCGVLPMLVRRKFDIHHDESHTTGIKGAEFYMSMDNRDIWKIGIWFLLLGFVFLAIILPLLSADAPAAVIPVMFTLIFILEILFVFSLNPQQLVSTAYHSEIRPRSPPNR